MLGTYLFQRLINWPRWWYGRGLIGVGRYALRQAGERYEFIGLGVWLKNLFVPMFGQEDIEGRLISFFIRLVQIIARAVVFLVWVGWLFLVFLAWLLAPVVIIIGILHQINFI